MLAAAIQKKMEGNVVSFDDCVVGHSHGYMKAKLLLVISQRSL
jgi:hypothetical protein